MTDPDAIFTYQRALHIEPRDGESKPQTISVDRETLQSLLDDARTLDAFVGEELRRRDTEIAELKHRIANFESMAAESVNMDRRLMKLHDLMGTGVAEIRYIPNYAGDLILALRKRIAELQGRTA